MFVHIPKTTYYRSLEWPIYIQCDFISAGNVKPATRQYLFGDPLHGTVATFKQLNCARFVPDRPAGQLS